MIKKATEWLSTLRCTYVVTRTKATARMKGATVEFELGNPVFFGRGFKFNVKAGSRNRVEIGDRCYLQENVLILLNGGTLKLGYGVHIRRGTVIDLSGELEMAGGNIISYYNIIHCSDRIRLAQYASTNEFVTLVDSRHVHDGSGEHFFHSRESAPIDIGRNVWIANKSSVLMGVTVGDEATIAGHAVVHKDVPAGALVGGVPAKVLRENRVGPGPVPATPPAPASAASEATT